MEIVGRRMLGDVGKGSVILVEMGMWDCVATLLLLFSILGLVLVVATRTKNAKGKGKAAEEFVERAIKKRKGYHSQAIKKGNGASSKQDKGKRVVSESDEDDIEALFEEDPREEHKEAWEQSIAKRGINCERRVYDEKFEGNHPVIVALRSQGLGFLFNEAEGYVTSFVREFYSNMREDAEKEFVLNTLVRKTPIVITPQTIAEALKYKRPQTSDRPYPFRPLTSKSPYELAVFMCSNPRRIEAFVQSEFTQGKFKPEYALMNKIIHNCLVPKGKEKAPKEEKVRILYEVMNGGLIDFASVMWCVMRDFIKTTHWKTHMPYPVLITKIVLAHGVIKPAGEKLVSPKTGPFTSGTERKSKAAPKRGTTSQASTAAPPAAQSNTSPIKSLERKIKGWLKCILGKQRSLEHRMDILTRQQQEAVGSSLDAPSFSPNLEKTLSEELDKFIDDDEEGSEEEEEE